MQQPDQTVATGQPLFLHVNVYMLVDIQRSTLFNIGLSPTDTSNTSYYNNLNYLYFTFICCFAVENTSAQNE